MIRRPTRSTRTYTLFPYRLSSDLAAARAYRFARRHATDPRCTFGTGKVGDLAGFASALVLAIFAIGIAVESIRHLVAPAAIAYGEALWIALLGLIVNLASAWLQIGRANVELQSLMRISYAVFCLKKKITIKLIVCLKQIYKLN